MLGGGRDRDVLEYFDVSVGWVQQQQQQLEQQQPEQQQQLEQQQQRRERLRIWVMDEERREQLQRRFIRQQRRLRWAERRAEGVTQRWKERDRKRWEEEVRTVPHASCAAALRETKAPLRSEARWRTWGAAGGV